jgi:hypothetical protein
MLDVSLVPPYQQRQCRVCPLSIARGLRPCLRVLNQVCLPLLLRGSNVVDEVTLQLNGYGGR